MQEKQIICFVIKLKDILPANLGTDKHIKKKVGTDFFKKKNLPGRYLMNKNMSSLKFVYLNIFHSW